MKAESSHAQCVQNKFALKWNTLVLFTSITLFYAFRYCDKNVSVE